MTSASREQAKKVRYLRSVRLEADLANQADDYVITPQVRLVLRRILNALTLHGTERALTLTGPYGTGKSAFALFLSRLLGDTRGSALQQLEDVDRALAEEVLHLVPRPFCIVPLTLRRARLSTLLLEAIARRADELEGGQELSLLAANLAQAEDGADSRLVLDTLQSLQSLAHTNGFGGVLLIFDELGKSLEFEARYGSNDLYLLQELAEVAARSAQNPLLFVGVLHQGFEQYGEHLLASARKEWGKVQGRFADIAFLEPPEQQMRLAAQALRELVPQPCTTLHGLSQQAAQAIITLQQAPSTLSASEFLALAADAAPLHPATLIALPHMFRRFAQNERSLFAYLLSGEPYAVPALWGTKGQDSLIRLCDLFDYFVENLLPSLSRGLYARRWLEVLDALGRQPRLAPQDLLTLKTIGILGILGDSGALHATFPLLCVALADTADSPAVRASLNRLQQASLIHYRAYNQSYRIWEGSDIDLEAKLEEGRRAAHAGFDLSGLLERYLPRRPLVGRRHSFFAGTLRYFEVHYTHLLNVAHAIRPDAGGEGVLLCVLPTSQEDAEAFRVWAGSPEVAQRQDLIVVIPQQVDTLREAALEVHALHWLKDNTPELRDDRVARREVNERLAQMDTILSSAVGLLLDPRPQPEGSNAQYWYAGEQEDVSTPRAAVEFISEVLDGLYEQSPRILNELINRRLPSAAAAAGRRNLIEAMFDPQRRTQPRLGMAENFFKPERSMYESILHYCKVHVPADPSNEDGEWHFIDPPEEHFSNLFPVWKALSEAVFGAAAPLNAAELFGQLNAPPYGLTAGLYPIILAAFMQAHPHEISFYREGKFIPEPSIADMEVLIRRPELFALMGSRSHGARATVIERIARGYQVEAALVPVVRVLFRGVRSLPETAHRTKNLPTEVLRLREAFAQARSPEQLLFQDIPEALGFSAISDETTLEEIERFFVAFNTANATWRQHAEAQLSKARKTFLTALGFAPNDNGWEALLKQAQQLKEWPLPTSLIPLINRLSASGDTASILDGVLALIAGRSPRAWTDADAERFEAQAASIAQTYRIAAEQLGYATPEIEQQASHYAEQLRQALQLHSNDDLTADKAAVRLALLQLLQELS